MSNSKATKQEMVFPPLLNLAEDRPQIIKDFNSVEHINAPYLNGMITPLWKKEESYVNKPVWDYKDNKYEIIDGYLTKNGQDLFPVRNKHFEKEDVTDELSKYMSFDFDDDGVIATLEWIDETNSVKFTYGNYSRTESNIFVNGIVISSRVRVMGTVAIGVVIYEVNGVFYRILFSNGLSGFDNNGTGAISWTRNVPRTNVEESWITSNTRQNVTSEIKTINPVINIADLTHNNVVAYGVSIISDKDILYTRKAAYDTVIWCNGTLFGDPYPRNTTQTETITTYDFVNVSFSQSASGLYSVIQCIQKSDNQWYYAQDPNTLLPDQSNPAFLPRATTSTVEVEGQTYYVYVINQYHNRIDVTTSIDNLAGQTEVPIHLETNDGYVYEGAFDTNTRTLSFSNTLDSWTATKRILSSGYVHFDGVNYNIDNFYKELTISIPHSETVEMNFVTYPNIVLDNGLMYSLYTFPEGSYSESRYPIEMPKNNFLVESGRFTWMGFDPYPAIGFDVVEAHILNDYAYIGRSNCAGNAQAFWVSNTKLCNSGVKTPYQLYISKEAENTLSATACYTDYMNSSATDMLYYAGNSPMSEYLFYESATSTSEDLAYYNRGGFRAAFGKGTGWNLLYNIGDAGSIAIQGLSYSDEENEMGTLITPFASVSSDYYISGCKDFIVYTDVNNKIWKISIKDGVEIRQVFDNQYILVNTISYWNMWDAVHNKKFHYASDYNNRIKSGFDRTTYRAKCTDYYTKINPKRFASCINYNYNQLPRYPVCSYSPTVDILYHPLNENDIIPYIKTYGCEADESSDVQPIEVYWTINNSSTAKYLGSIKVYPSGIQTLYDSNLSTISFSSTKAAQFITCIFSTFINGAGNNDFVSEDYSKYPLVYNNQNEPMFLYNYSGGIDRVEHFFVIQGQYYGVIDRKLYAMIYNNGLVSQQDALADLEDLKYVGNNTTIAFFVNPYTKKIYSFTGDGALEFMFDASKFHFKLVDTDDNVQFFYNPSTQAIYVGTEEGLLVFGPANTYHLEEFTSVDDMEFIKGNIHIVSNDKITTLRYYHDEDEFDNLPLYIETSFFGIGSNESISIDRWNIILYDDEMREQDVYLQVRSLTDVSTQAEEKKLHIDKNGWDKWSHSALVSFCPKLIKGKGIRLTIKTTACIQRIIPHIVDNGTSVPTNKKFSI